MQLPYHVSKYSEKAGKFDDKMAEVKRERATLGEVLRILKKFRKKNSLWFVIKWAVIKRPKPDMNRLNIPLFLQFIGQWNKDSRALWYLYSGLKTEMSTMQALAAAAEIEAASRRQTEKVASERQRRLHHQMQKKKMKYLRQKYGRNIPPRYTMTEDQREKRLNRLRGIRAEILKRRKEKKEAVQKRALNIKRLREQKRK